MTVDSSALLRLPLLLHGLCGLGGGTDYGDRNPDACAGVDPAASHVPSSVRHSSILLENRFLTEALPPSGGSFYGNGSIPAADLKKKKQKPEDEKSLL